MKESSPYAPPRAIDDAQPEHPRPETLGRRILRVSIMFVGALLVGVALALALTTTDFQQGMLALGLFACGSSLVWAGIQTRPKRLSASKSQPRDSQPFAEQGAGRVDRSMRR